VVRKAAAFDERNAHRAEIVRCDRSGVAGSRSANVDVFEHQTVDLADPCERQAIHHTHGCYTGESSHAIGDPST
jgi:hypothetical protein